MSQYLTMARPYAKALMGQAEQAQTTREWLLVLSTLKQAVQVQAMRSILDSPHYQDHQRESILLAVVTALPDLSDSFLKTVKDFVKVLSCNQRLAILPEIFQLYQSQLEKREGIVTAQVRSARALVDKEVASVKQYLNSTLSAQAQLELSVDASLIGGIVIQVGSWVLDGSVSNRLARLSESLRG